MFLVRRPGVGDVAAIRQVLARRPLSQAAICRDAMQAQVLPALDRYRPEFVLASAGFDALAWDRVARLSLQPESFGWMTNLLVQLAQRHAAGRLVSVLEGGYALGNLGRAVAAHLRALLGD